MSRSADAAKTTATVLDEARLKNVTAGSIPIFFATSRCRDRRSREDFKKVH